MLWFRFTLIFGLLTGFFTSASAVEVNLAIYKFNGPALPYVEISTNFIGNTLKLQKIDTIAHQATLEVTTVFMLGEKIVKADKYLLNGPLTVRPVDFLDVKRYSLEPGQYRMLTHFVDMNDTTNQLSTAVEFSLFFEKAKVQFSDIQLLSDARKAEVEGPMVKSGLYMVPVAGNYFPKQFATLFAYLEVYHAESTISKKFGLCSYIERADQAGGKIDGYTHCKTYHTSDVVPIILQKNIALLPSGNYNFVIEFRDTLGNILFDRKAFFQRSNPSADIASVKVDEANYENSFIKSLDESTVQYALRALAVIISSSDADILNAIIANKNTEIKRKYLYNHWVNFDPVNTEKSYQKFMNLAKQVDAAFVSGFGYGFETDRGRIWLKYGPPNDKISVEEDPNAPPYEIWVYNEFPKTKQGIVKFLFYNPNLGNDYILLHSNCRTEVNNPRWLKELYKGAKSNYNADEYNETGKISDGFLKHASEYFKDL